MCCPVAGSAGVAADGHRLSCLPVYDRHIHRFYLGAASRRYDAHEALWPVLQADLCDQAGWLADTVERHQTEAGGALALLRAADIIIWEHQVAGCRLRG